MLLLLLVILRLIIFFVLVELYGFLFLSVEVSGWI